MPQGFPKGSPLVTDISEAVVKVTGNGQVEQLEKAMLSALSCSSPLKLDGSGSIGTEPFSALFKVAGGIAALAFGFTMVLMVVKKLRIWSCMKAVLVNQMFWKWIYIYLSQNSTRSRFNLANLNFDDTNNNGSIRNNTTEIV